MWGKKLQTTGLPHLLETKIFHAQMAPREKGKEDMGAGGEN